MIVGKFRAICVAFCVIDLVVFGVITLFEEVSSQKSGKIVRGLSQARKGGSFYAFVYKIVALVFVMNILAAFDYEGHFPIYDGFEANKISNNWSKRKFLPKTVSLQSEIVRKGKSALKITLKQGDQIEEEKGTELERAELIENSKLVSKEDNGYIYSFSMFLPADFPVAPIRLVIAQWKQYCENDDVCGVNSPVIAVRYIAGQLIINIKVGLEKVILYSSAEEIRNRWLDFTFKIYFSRKEGQIYAQLNGKDIIAYAGQIGYTENEGYPPKSYYYFKMGLYRDTTPETMTIYIDEYKKALLPENSFKQ